MAKTTLASISVIVILFTIFILIVAAGVLALLIGKGIKSEGVTKLGYLLIATGLILNFLLVLIVIGILIYKTGGYNDLLFYTNTADMLIKL